MSNNDPIVRLLREALGLLNGPSVQSRVNRLGLVDIQDFTHAARLVQSALWVREGMIEARDEVRGSDLQAPAEERPGGGGGSATAGSV